MKTRLIYVNGIRFRVTEETYRQHLENLRQERIKAICKQDNEERLNRKF